MKEIFKPGKISFEALTTPEKGCWINYIVPDEAELAELRTLVDFPDEILYSLKDKEEIPTIEEEKGQTFILLRTPNKATDLKYVTVPLGIFLLNDKIITVCFHRNEVIERVKHTFKGDTHKELLLRLLLLSSKTYLNYLVEINNTIDHLESQLYKSQKNKEIAKLLGLEQSLVYFSTSLQSNEILIAKIASSPKYVKNNKEKEIFDQTIDETKQAIAMTNTYINILSNLMDAFASMISNNLNIVMKILTSITIVIAIPTLIASIYGMNIDLPLQGHPMAFVIVMLMSLFFAGVFLLYFWKNDLI